MSALKPFKLEDLGSFLPNEFSSPDEIFPLFLTDCVQVQTLWGESDGLVQAILCYRNYWGACWEGFFLISQQFKPNNAILLHDMIWEGMAERKALRLQTESVSTPELRKWHKFLGFELEGVKQKMMFNRDYDCWAIVRQEA